MNPGINSVGQPYCSGAFSNKDDGLRQKKESAGSYASRSVSVHQNQEVQPSIQKPIKHEEHSRLGGYFDVGSYRAFKHEAPPLYFGQDIVRAERKARLEKLHHPSVHLKVDGYSKKIFVGCLDFKQLLKGRIEILPTISGSGFSAHPLGGSKERKVEMEWENEETIITFTGDDEIRPTKLHISNEYWKHNSIKVLIEKYKSMNLI
ncbi:hypothetical protein [Endozoicomonas sp. 8E]|uniref:hypothetical protein n=1 Tax=Endozoicomonas sp. 8E TaxID=3035692 RepID=UPI0029392167|nr:hypothetical protein [Endozoicomonas sp. 8E]WOG25872.1 hypothetical protein P6910_14965 [Endozoicomonas sp. 8E]